MSGIQNGLQAILQTIHPTAMYIHCMAHRVNLALVNCCKSSSSAINFFSTLETLYNIFSQPKHHSTLNELILKLGFKKYEISSLSDTRWACRYKTVFAVSSNMPAIIEALKLISRENSKAKFEGIGLLTSISSLDFKFSLAVFASILSIIHVLHKALQSESNTLSTAISVIKSTIITLNQLRNDNDWKILCEKSNITDKDCSLLYSKRKCQENLHPDFLCETSVGLRPHFKNKSDVFTHFKTSLYFSALDCITTELNRRFSPENLVLALAVNGALKCKSTEIDSLLNRYAKLLDIDIVLVKTEMRMVSTSLPPNFTFEDLSKLISKSLYPNYFKLLQLALTFPIGSVKCERSISALRRIHTFNRTNMNYDRLTNLCLLAIEPNIMSSIPTAQIVSKFAETKSRRLLLC